jgi:arylsulfatase A-like enzyme
MGASSLACYGNPDVETPNIDRLAVDGCLFERAYCNNPVCMPSRATLFTGMTPRQHGVITNGVRLSSDVPTVTEVLGAAGYRTFGAGKIHLQPGLDGGRPLAQFSWEDRARWEVGEIASLPADYYGLGEVYFASGHVSGCFGQYANECRRAHPEVSEAYRRNGPGPQGTAQLTWRTGVPAELHYNHWIADRTIEFLRDVPSAQPFFAWCSFPDPHGPWAAARPYCDMYDPDSLHLDPTWREMADPLAFLADYRSALPPFLRVGDETGLRETIAQFYGMISHVDHNVGRVMKALHDCERDADTIAVFLTDHGEYAGSHGLMGKTPWPYEPLLRVPCIWRVPRARETGLHASAAMSLLDFVPTILDFAGFGPSDILPEGFNRADRCLPGRSLRPLLEGGELERRPCLVEFENNARRGPPLHMRALIGERYKLVLYPPHPKGLLFDLAEDPGERRNLWSDHAHAEIRDAMVHELLEEIVRTDRINLPREAGA